ncbi:MAG: hypothetical protein ACLUQK_13840 [Clostridium sp.]|uniref:hypothetical protein n=2 Tax=Bacteria TaxID=2 RepID=UPI001AF33F9C|nr:hypothetical protein [[Clostridium] innocuum]QSI24797.1 hypothetical protein GKZ87_04370 [Erysipelotrichaceae bacterium 66202529]MCC2833656.1 hypothetical protein [[Clostridium] innocuum]MCR0246379.1 hypothetical protein [[Clostridium] innocuum]MCR0262191.1 hypothetical protein [[Clostridium] innocuum]MCR0393265.1 hypothetical protein [[Clostridium] innocuum]
MMNSQKKQKAAIAVTALSVTAILSPTALYAVEDNQNIQITLSEQMEGKKLEQGIPSKENNFHSNVKIVTSQGQSDIQTINSKATSSMISNSNNAITDASEAEGAIADIINYYGLSNETTEQEINDILIKSLVDTGKLENASIVSYSKGLDATENAYGYGEILFQYKLYGQPPLQSLFIFSIPRLPKAGEISINSTNFPDELFRKVVRDRYDTDKDGVLSVDEINNVTVINLTQFENRGIKSVKGIEYFNELNELNCTGTAIEELDISRNLNLKTFACASTKINTLDINNNTKLKYLDYSSTKINTLDVHNITELTDLYCNDTEISEIDVSKNTKLRNLGCKDTRIKELNLSKNPELMALYCANTEISELDVSSNPALIQLYCYDTPLAWLNIGTNNQMIDSEFRISDSNLTIQVPGETFDITKLYPGIDPSKITNLNGAQLHGNMVSGYKRGIPIEYEYDCGSTLDGPKKLKVTLNLKKDDSKIKIAGNLDMEYTGKPITPIIDKSGSGGEITFTYEKWNGDSWQAFHSVPTHAGTYTIQAHLAEDDFYNEADSEKMQFTISRATNSWKERPIINGWIYGEQANTLKASAKFGDALYSYSASKDGTYTDKVPTDAGTWYAKAIVTETGNYTGLEDIIRFTITPKGIENIKIPELKNDMDVENLIIKDGEKELEKGIDYVVDKNSDSESTMITITFKGNYKGSITESYENEKAPDAKHEKKPIETKKTKSVETNDNTRVHLFAIMSLLSAGYMATLLGKKKKRKE